MCRLPFCSWTNRRSLSFVNRTRWPCRRRVGAGLAKAKNVAKPQRTAFGNAEIEPKSKVVEFAFRRRAARGWFDYQRRSSAAGEMVDVAGVTQGKGLCRRDETLELRRSSCYARRSRFGPRGMVELVAARIRVDASRAGSGRRHRGAPPHPAEPRIRPHRCDPWPPVRQRLRPGTQGQLVDGTDAIKLPRNDSAPDPAGLVDEGEDRDLELPPPAWSTTRRCTKFRRRRATRKSTPSLPSRKPVVPWMRKPTRPAAAESK